MQLTIKGETVEVTPVSEFRFPEPGSTMFKLTCRNHPTAKYLTKNPYERNLHLIESPEGFGECACPFKDLVVY